MKVHHSTVIGLLVFAFSMLVSCVSPREVAKPDRAVVQAHRDLARGVTLDSVFDRPDNADWVTLQRGDLFREIRRAGFTAVRLPVHFDRAPRSVDESGALLHPSWMDRIDRVVRSAARAGLAVIVVARTGEDLSDPAVQERVVADWAALAAHLRNAHRAVSFELMDAPNARITDAAWSRLAEELRLAIRQSNPDRVLIIGPAQRYHPAHLVHLDLPPDPHIVFAFAYDEPSAFTRQGDPSRRGSEAWIGTTWNGDPDELRRIEEDLDRAARWARERKRKLLCADFGSSAAADPASRAQWTFFVARALEERDIAWAYRSFAGPDGVYDSEWRMWRQPLLGMLTDR